MLQLRDVDDYKDWSLQMKAILRDKELWDIVEGTDEPPKAENDDAASMAWSHKNAMALEVIWCNCDSWSLFGHTIWNITSAKIAWDTLAAKCTLPKTGFEFLADDGDNYLDWSLQVKAILTDRQLWDIVEGTDDSPKAEKNDVGLELIQYSCRRSSLGREIWYITTAKIAWDALAAICALPKSAHAQTFLI